MTRNSLIKAIITRLGGTPIANTRNGLLQHWLDAAKLFFRKVYTFTGADYATFLAWTPLNAVFSYGADVVATTAATGLPQRLVFGDTVVGDHFLTLTGTGAVAVVYRDTSGSSRSIIGNNATSGVSQSAEAKYYTDRVELWQYGQIIGTSFNPPELASISAIASSLAPSLFFGGTISNVFCTSTSPMQNVNVMAGNGTNRYASIPTFAPIAFTSKQWVRFDDLSTAARIWGNNTSGNKSRLAISTAGGVVLTDLSGTGLSTSSRDIIEGQDHYLETEVLADGSCEIWVDGVSQASASAGAFDGLAWDIESIYRAGGSNSTGIITYQVFQDLTTGVAHTYNNTDNYVSGGSVILPDSTGGADGTWVNAVIGDLDYLPTTDRLYRANEGEGAVLHNAYDSSGATDATIQNYIPSSWSNAGQ